MSALVQRLCRDGHAVEVTDTPGGSGRLAVIDDGSA